MEPGHLFQMPDFFTLDDPSTTSLTSSATWHAPIPSLGFVPYLGFNTFHSFHIFITEPLQSLAWVEFNTSYYIPFRYRAIPPPRPSSYEATTFAYVALYKKGPMLEELRDIPSGKENWRPVQHYARFLVQLVLAHGVEQGGLWAQAGLMEQCETAFGVLFVLLDIHYHSAKARGIRVNMPEGYESENEDEESDGEEREGKTSTSKSINLGEPDRQMYGEHYICGREEDWVRDLDEEVAMALLHDSEEEEEGEEENDEEEDTEYLDDWDGPDEEDSDEMLDLPVEGYDVTTYLQPVNSVDLTALHEAIYSEGIAVDDVSGPEESAELEQAGEQVVTAEEAAIMEQLREIRWEMGFQAN